jgi:hypothetical protein
MRQVELSALRVRKSWALGPDEGICVVTRLFPCRVKKLVTDREKEGQMRLKILRCMIESTCRVQSYVCRTSRYKTLGGIVHIANDAQPPAVSLRFPSIARPPDYSMVSSASEAESDLRGRVDTARSPSV